jgi:anti-sigma-K factor RskA
MNPAHAELKLNAAAYVLGSLEADERESFEAHLKECGECTAEVRSLLRTTNALAHAVPQRTPSAELRARVLSSIDSAKASAATRARPPSSPVMMWLPLAASLILVAAVGAYAVRLQTRLGELQSSMAVMSAPDLVRIDLAGQPTAPQSTGRALWSRDRGMVFATANLPAPPAGKVYQVWVVTAQAPVSAGLVVPDSAGGGTMYFYTPPDIPQPTAVAVTLEPAGGVPSPTGQFYLVGKPASL